VDLFASEANHHCDKWYALHWCMRAAGINAFGQLWTIRENCWITYPYILIGKVWRSLRERKGLATMLIPLRESAPWWELVCLDTNNFVDNVADWAWLPRDDSSLFVAGTAQGRAVLPPDWPFMVVRVDFTEPRPAPFLNKRERCIRGVAPTTAASLGIANSKVGVSGWDLQSFDESDPVEVALAVGLRESAVAHVASSTATAYRGPWSFYMI